MRSAISHVTPLYLHPQNLEETEPVLEEAASNPSPDLKDAALVDDLDPKELIRRSQVSAMNYYEGSYCSYTSLDMVSHVVSHIRPLIICRSYLPALKRTMKPTEQDAGRSAFTQRLEPGLPARGLVPASSNAGARSAARALLARVNITVP